MKKELKDYLHLYLGCECLLDNDKSGKLVGFDSRLHDADIEMVCYTIQHNNDEDDWTVFNDDETFSRIKPILRPLSGMTEEESIESSKLLNLFEFDLTSFIHEAANVTQYLLSKHFDLFGLIEAGLAIDKTKNPA